ncbi:YihY/virulence factor BrkB family protein [Halomonas sediminis]|uniref:YihY family inner membrane protein n=1 Tax=Vreelandella zhuhanensis TaxID=2684210 RepID=A0A7X3GYZ2_9GAMM|nr:YihY/virulence factor BrkB family protein [Halomonas zhuhanensis]MWJ27129.1 YihY family inner membrane protein [Halomonas zhuhanensis]
MSERLRGREAEVPCDIPVKGWLDIAWRVKQQMEAHRITMLAAGVAFYALLAIFPAIAAMISLWGLLFDPYDIIRQLNELSRLMPPNAATLIDEQAQKLIEEIDTGPGITAALGTVLAIFVASKGVTGLVVGLNVVYGQVEKRGLTKRILVVAALTFGLLGITLLTLGFIALFPLVVNILGIHSPYDRIVGWLRWPPLLVLMSVLIALLYRFAPYRRAPRWQWLSVGTLVATGLWLLGSGGLSLYVRYFANFSELYGSLGAVVVLMLWFWLSAFVILLGAEINCQMERQTRLDTTVGEPRPMGERKAHAADTLGPMHPWQKPTHHLPSDED